MRKKDLSDVPFAPNVTFESPLSSRIEGKGKVVEFLTGMFPVVNDVRIQRHIAEGEYVATTFDLDTTFVSYRSSTASASQTAC